MINVSMDLYFGSGIVRGFLEVIGGIRSTVSEIAYVTQTDNGDGTDTIVIEGSIYDGTYTVPSADRVAGRPLLVVPAVWTESATAGIYERTDPLFLVSSDTPTYYSSQITDFAGSNFPDTSPFTPADNSGHYYQYSAANIHGVTTGPDITIQDNPLTKIGFNDSLISVPSENETRQYAAAFRMTADSANWPDFFVFLGANNDSAFRIDKQSDGVVRFRLRSSSSTPIDYSSSTSFTLSVLALIDLDQGLPSGATAQLYLNDGTGWILAIDDNSTSDLVETISQRTVFGSQSSSKVGGDAVLDDFYWQTNALPSNVIALRDDLFEANGSVKRLGRNGVAGGLIPLHFLQGFNFQDGKNSGTGFEWSTSRTPITVTEV